jgi:hypothetical protein
MLGGLQKGPSDVRSLKTNGMVCLFFGYFHFDERMLTAIAVVAQI